MRKVLLMTVMAACMAAAGCNTVSGVGKDTTSAGKAVTKSAEDAKN